MGMNSMTMGMQQPQGQGMQSQVGMQQGVGMQPQGMQSQMGMMQPMQQQQQQQFMVGISTGLAHSTA